MADQSTRSLAAVWFADIVGYTSLSEQNEDAALRLVAELQAIAGREVPAHSGRIVKFVGDAALAAFESAGNAVEAALAVRDAFQQSQAARDIDGFLRIGVHVGEITTAPDGDVYGDGINTASRIQGVAAPGQVLLSSFAVESIRHRPEFRTEAKGQRKMKGLSRSLDLFSVGWEGAVDPFLLKELPEAQEAKALRTHYGRAIAVGLVAGMAGLVGLGMFAGAGPFGGGEDRIVGETVLSALQLGIEDYYMNDMDGAAEKLSLFMDPAGTPEERRRGLRYLARTHLMNGDSSGVEAALQQLLTEEPPLALLLPSLEDSVLIDLYLEARREKQLAQGRVDPTEAVRELMLFDFQVFTSGLEMGTEGMAEEAGYAVAFMLETELNMAGIQTASVKEMSFQNRGDQAYEDLESILTSMSGEGPSHLLTGSVAINQTGALLSAWVYELETGRLVVNEQFSGSQEDLLMDLPEKMGARITHRLLGAGGLP